MRPRKFDDRVGFFTEDFQDYGDIKQSPGRERPLHHPVAAGEARPGGRAVRAQEADRLLRRPRGPRQVPRRDQEGRRALAARVREGWLQEGHHRQGRPDRPRGPGLGRRGRPLLDPPMAPRHDRKRDGAARPRPQDRRDPRSRHPDLSQHPQAGTRLVLHPGVAKRPPKRSRPCRCPTT